MRDRGFMLLFGIITAGLYIFFAFTPITYATLLTAVVLLTTSFLFVASAQNGLTSTIGQQHAMSGQISAVWNIFTSIPTVAALLAGGPLSNLLKDTNADQAGRILFLIGAAIMASAVTAEPRWIEAPCLRHSDTRNLMSAPYPPAIRPCRPSPWPIHSSRS